MRSLLILPLLLLAGCDFGGGDDGSPGTNGTQTGAECVASDLVAQCPPGSSPDLQAAAVSECNGQADLLLSGEGGSVRGACRGSGECLVVCNFDAPCQCGVDRITTEGVFCTPCDQASSCGNSICEGGEDPTTCPLDCAASCQAGMRRCNGRDREDCDGQGQWARVACRSDQACQIGAGGVACLPDLSPSGGTYEGTGWENVRLPADPAEIYLAEAELSGCTEGNCWPLAWLDDQRVLASDSGQLGVFSTQAGTPESLSLQIAPQSLGHDLPWVLVPDRQPQILNVQTRQRRNAEAVVDDVTPLTWTAAAVDAGNTRGAVSFSAAGQPFIALYDLGTGSIEAMLRYAAPGFTEAAASLAFSPDGSLLAELRPEGRCIVWNVEEGKHVRLIDLEPPRPGFPTGATAVAFTRGGGPYLVATTGSSLEVWDLDGPERVRHATGQPGRSIGGAFSISPDGRILATHADGGVGLFYLRTLEHIRTLSAAFSPLTPHVAAFSPDGRRLVITNLVFGSWAE